jgi:hypothetical protein
MRLTALALGALLTAGCHAAFDAAAPSGFVELKRQHDYDWRAVSADGAVLAVRELDHDPNAQLEFWTAAIEGAMRQRGGYALLGRSDFTTKDGLKGRELKFGHDEGSRPHLYDLAIILTSSKIYLLEAGGAKPLIERNAASIDAWLSAFRAKSCAPFPFMFACRTLRGDDQPR